MQTKDSTTPRIVAYDKALDIRNADSLPPGRGASYLECVSGLDGALVAKCWRRKVPANAEIVVCFKGEPK